VDTTAQRVLIVDDEPRILDAFRRTLRSRYQVVTAGSGPEGLDLLGSVVLGEAPFGVIVSDMLMPVMNGAEFLTRAREVSPDSVQLVLSGQADLMSTIQAVNHGKLFRFLTKPCSAEELSGALDDGLRQYQLVVSERELLERTLQGAVEALTEILSFTSPLAFSRGRVFTEFVEGVVRRLGVPMDWQLRMAAMLSQVGCVAIPADVVQRGRTGQLTNPVQVEMLEGHPGVARDLLARIPRLEEVARWVGEQPVQPVTSRGPRLKGSEAVFHAVAAFLVAADRGEAPREIVRELRASGRYAPDLLDALLEASAPIQPEGELHELKALQLREGMLLVQDVVTATGMVLVRTGERISPTLAVRLANFARTVGVVEPIKVLVQSS